VSFSFDQVIELLIALGAVVGAFWGVIAYLSRKIENAFAAATTQREDLRLELSRRHDELGQEVRNRSHDLRTLIHEEAGELHKRIDEVRTEYVRREDIQALTSAMHHLTTRLDTALAVVGARP
jgi:hypothetical protein